ncbi:MAG TPA: hypothetical protein VN805_02580 [Caulobacteraceae bacterium]|nr:hypothetical protein [Caulobacteraceae bacterium]
MSALDIGLIVVFGPLALAVLVLSLIDYADRRSTAPSRAGDKALLRELERRTHMEDRLRSNN